MKLAMIVALFGSLALTASPASASVSHVFTATLGATSSTPADPYPLAAPSDVEVDQASHDIYVTDPGNHRVEKFDSSGHFLLMFGKGVNSGTGNPNVCTNAGAPTDICQPGISGTATGQFETPTYLAVDNTSSPSKGDVYVADTGSGLVQKFDSSGHIVTSWGTSGQKDGSDTDLSSFTLAGPIFGIAVGPPNGTLYVGGNGGAFNNVFAYTQGGTYEPPYRNIGGSPLLKVDSEANLYYSSGSAATGEPTVWKALLLPGGPPAQYQGYQFGTAGPLTGFGFDPSSEEIYQDTGTAIDHYSADCNPPSTGPCDPLDAFGSGQLSGGKGLAVDAESHTVYVANSGENDIAAFGDVRPIVTTGHPTGATGTSVTLTGHVDPAGRGEITECHFEFGFDKTYGHSIPCSPGIPPTYTAPTDVTATVEGLSPGTTDHYRLVVSNSAGATSDGLDEVFSTTHAPAIDGLSSANLTATSADLNAQVNPNGLETTYRFEYGPTTAYGQSEPTPDGTLSASAVDQGIAVHLGELVPHVVYHYRLVAENEDGSTVTEDHTFNFFPPSCPNENVRQQTQANYLPDCRAYELVSPANAAGTQLYPAGPNTGYATNPSRFSYTGLYSIIPNSGGSPIDGLGDLYVATRTDTGWVTKYVGLQANQAAVDGGPPLGLPNTGSDREGLRTSQSDGGSTPDIIQNNVLTDPAMDTFLDWNDGNQAIGSALGTDAINATPTGSNAPYVWSSEGKLLDRWPTNLGSVPAGSYPAGWQLYTRADYVLPGDHPLAAAPGGAGALNCPGISTDAHTIVSNICPGDVTASSNLSHFVFATEWNVFAPGGQLSAPGSVYDNNTRTGSVAVASKTSAGDDIPSEQTDPFGDPLQIPAVSGDGSHILIAAPGTGPCGISNCPLPPCSDYFGAAFRCPTQASHLYMRVDDAITYDVSQGHDVKYVASTEDGSKVYFTTSQQLSPEDRDASIDLYMWSEQGEREGHPITLVSKANSGGGGIGDPGNSDACNASFTESCNVVTYSFLSYCQLPSGVGGNCRSDGAIASENGDIYFFSPEQLDGSLGIPNQENLYDFRNEKVQYVATLTTGPYCTATATYSTSACGVESDGPVVRMQVTPNDSHMAFVTASPVTQYNNAGHLEMYTFNPATSDVVCVSCIPSGAPPTSDVEASQDGLFLTTDGRTFFTTNDALVHGDTNHAIDVYEYVDGRPQLITPGTGETRQQAGIYTENSPGLLGVSANGTDVYFSTLDTLVSQDHNGLFLKFYDARAGGGFPAPAPPPPCDAADECHGSGSAPPSAVQNGSEAPLGVGGNFGSPTSHQNKGGKKRHHKRRDRGAKHRAAGSRPSANRHGGGG